MAHFEVLVIGSGTGGYAAAVKAAQLGLKTAIVERNELGGTCLNQGCIPTKALLNAASIYHQAQHFSRMGIFAENIAYDLPAIYRYKDDIVSRLREDIALLLQRNQIELIQGVAQIVAPDTVRVGEMAYQAQHIIIASGSRPLCPDIPGIDLPGVVTSDDLLNNADSFSRLLIIGAGVIGMEFAAIYHNLDIEVTVVEKQERILPYMDREISQNLAMISKRRGIDIRTGTSIQEIRLGAEGLRCLVDEKGRQQSLVCDRVLVAIGRQAVSQGLFSSELAVDTNQQTGQIIVDGEYRTSIGNIYAIGDVTNRSSQLAHMAAAEGINIAYQIAGLPKQMDLGIVPYCVFSEPEIASVGLTESAAKARGMAVRSGKYLFGANAKGLIVRSERGFVKIVCEEQSRKIIGAQLMCPHAADMVNELSLAIAQGLTVDKLHSFAHPHPTFGEGIAEAAENIFGMAIHAVPRSRTRKNRP